MYSIEHTAIYTPSRFPQISVIFLPIAEEWEVHYDYAIPRLKYMKGITFQYAFCTELAISKLQKV